MFTIKKIVNTILEVEVLRKKKKISNLKKVLITFIILLILWILGFYMYVTYENIEINEADYTIDKTSSTVQAQTVESVEETSKNVADVIEETTSKVVGISKLKNTGSSIFSKTTESELGLGTGFLVSEDGYIVSNEHVTGGKYSQCYVTLENGKTYEATVVWSDSDLDLSLSKIDVKNLEYVNLGDSNKVRVGETVYAIRKSNWF